MRDRSIRPSILAATLLAAILLIAASAPQADAREPAPSLDSARIAGPDVAAGSDPALARGAERKPVGKSRLRRKLSRLAKRAPGASGFYVYDAGAAKKRVLFDRKQGKRRKLASNMKLFTTATALKRLGARERIETRVKPAGKIRSGRLRGNLHLIGAGDPSLGRAGMRELANEVRRAGIRRVRGSVLADDSVFDRRRGVPDSNFGPSPYIAPLSGLVYGGSTYSGDPAVDAAQAFRSRLRKAGVKVRGKAKLGRLPGKHRKGDAVAEYRSPTIASLAAATNKPSNNFYAEMLLKRLAAKPGKKGTTRRGARAVERYARGLGARVDAKDGSGLTDGNRASPRDVVRLLVRSKRQRNVGRPLSNSLAVAGREGTLGARMRGTSAEGECRGKTGTINGVSNLSGLCGKGKRLVAFSLLMNGVGSYDAARDIQDRMVVQIARYRR